MPLIVWLAGLARAHDPVGSYAIRPLLDDASLVGAWTTWGLVVDEGGSFQRVCHEALPDVRDVFLRPDGTVLLARSDGLWSTADGGCTLTAGPSTSPVSLLADVGDALLAVTDDAGGDGVLRSADGGGSFLATSVLPASTDVRSAASSSDGAWWVAGLSGGAPVVWRSADQGASWAAVGVPAGEVLAVSVHGPGLGAPMVVSGTLSDGTGVVWAGDETSLTVAAVVPLSPTGFACAGGRCFVAVEQGVLLVIDETGDPPWAVDTVEGPARCLWPDAGAIWGCTDVSEADHFAWTADGVGWTGFLPRADVVERTCPAGSEAATACAPPDPTGTDSTGDTGTTVEVKPAGCGCSHGRAASLAVAPTLVALLARRRPRAQGAGAQGTNCSTRGRWSS